MAPVAPTPTQALTPTPTLVSKDFSILDNSTFDTQSQYDEYVAEQKKWKDYYYDDWCLGFTGLASYEPTYYEGGDYVQAYQSEDSYIDITSYEIGTVGSSGKLTSDLKECVKLFKTMLNASTDTIEINIRSRNDCRRFQCLSAHISYNQLYQ